MRDITLGDTIYHKFTTRAFATGIPTTLGGTPVLSIYEQNNLTQITAGVSVTADYDSVTGLNQATIVATFGNGYESGKSYDLVITVGTVSTVSVVGEVVHSFTVQSAPVNWDKVTSPTTAVDLSATDIQLSDAVTTLTNLPTIPANWLTAAGIAATALNGKGDWNIGKTGYSLTQAFPNNFSDLSITATTGRTSVGTNNDKSGYLISGTKTTLDSLNDIASTAIVSAGAITTLTGAVSTVSTVTDGAKSAALATAQTDLDTITGTDGVTLATAQALYAPNKIVPDAAGVAPTAVEVRQEIDTNSTQLSAIVLDTGTTLDNHLTDIKGTGFVKDTHSLIDIETYVDLIDDGTSGLAKIATDVAAILVDTNELQVDDVPGLIAALNNVSSANVLTQINSALDTAISELGVAAPTATPTLRTGLMLMYMMTRNKLVVQTSAVDAIEVYNNAGTKIASKLITDDGTDFTEAEML